MFVGTKRPPYTRSASVNDDEEEIPSRLAQAAAAVDYEMRAGAVHEVKLSQVENDRPALGIGRAQPTLKLWDRGDVELAKSDATVTGPASPGT